MILFHQIVNKSHHNALAFEYFFILNWIFLLSFLSNCGIVLVHVFLLFFYNFISYIITMLNIVMSFFLTYTKHIYIHIFYSSDNCSSHVLLKLFYNQYQSTTLTWSLWMMFLFIGFNAIRSPLSTFFQNASNYFKSALLATQCRSLCIMWISLTFVHNEFTFDML